jgi:hypothetical protein
VLHPHLATCWSALLDRFIHVFKWILPIYYALHFLPPILLSRGGRMLTRSGVGSARSSAFLSVFVVVYQGASFVSYCSPGMPMLPARVKTPILYLTPVSQISIRFHSNT